MAGGLSLDPRGNRVGSNPSGTWLPRGQLAAKGRQLFRHLQEHRLAISGLVWLAVSGPLLLWPSAGSSPAPRAIGRGAVTVTYPAPWSAVATGSGFAGVRLLRPLTLYPPGESLTVGPIFNQSPIPGGPPRAFVEQSDGRVTPHRLTIGSLSALMYVPSSEGPGDVLFVVPTARRDIGLLCHGYGGGGDPCAVSRLRLSLHGARAIAPGPDSFLEDRLRSALAQLASALGHDPVSVGEAGALARSLLPLAGAMQRAERRLGGLGFAPRYRRVLASLREALGSQADALRSASEQAAAESHHGYLRASAEVELAEAELHSSLQALRAYGFELPHLSGVELPPLPRAEETLSQTTIEVTPEGEGAEVFVPSGEVRTPAPHHQSPSPIPTERAEGLESK